MGEPTWNVYPENWMESDPRHHSMLGHIEGLYDRGWCIECAEFNPDPLYGRPEWRTEYELGYRYYVLRYNLFDHSKDAVSFYMDPKEAQEAFEHFRDPLGKHRS